MLSIVITVYALIKHALISFAKLIEVIHVRNKC